MQYLTNWIRVAIFALRATGRFFANDVDGLRPTVNDGIRRRHVQVDHQHDRTYLVN